MTCFCYCCHLQCLVSQAMNRLSRFICLFVCLFFILFSIFSFIENLELKWMWIHSRIRRFSLKTILQWMNCGFLQTRNTIGQISCKLMSQIPDSFRIQIRILINRTLSCNDQLLDLGWYVGKLTSQLNSSRHLKNFPADFYIHRVLWQKRCLWIKSKFFAENVSTVLIPFEQISRYTLYPKLSPPDMEFTI